jgi:UDP-N-acetylmuramate dehydrogenase
VLSESALARFLDQAHQLQIPWRLLGLGSNVLLPDEGLPGVTAVLEGDFLEMSSDGTRVTAGAGQPLARVARFAVDRGLAGLESLAGFPSTVGGAVIMNAGCYGVEIKDILESTTIVRPGGVRRQLRVEDLSPGYRTTNLQGGDAVVTQATFNLRPEDVGEALDRLLEINRRRRETMPSGRPNAGSVFKNPSSDYAGRLIEECGLKGLQRGGAEISSEHANVIVNNGSATAEDVLALMRVMYRAVLGEFAVSLEPELILVGSLETRWQRTT